MMVVQGGRCRAVMVVQGGHSKGPAWYALSHAGWAASIAPGCPHHTSLAPPCPPCFAHPPLPPLGSQEDARPGFNKGVPDVNLLRGGVVYCDAVTTVSPTYSREVFDPHFGMGMQVHAGPVCTRHRGDSGGMCV